MVKFLVDENIPMEAVTKLHKGGIDIRSVTEVKCGMDDNDVLSLANKEGRTLITCDKDFGELIFKRKEKCSGIILLRIHPQTTDYVTRILRKVMAINIDFKNSFCVVEQNRVRVIPLKEA